MDTIKSVIKVLRFNITREHLSVEECGNIDITIKVLQSKVVSDTLAQHFQHKPFHLRLRSEVVSARHHSSKSKESGESVTNSETVRMGLKGTIENSRSVKSKSSAASDDIEPFLHATLSPEIERQVSEFQNEFQVKEIESATFSKWAPVDRICYCVSNAINGWWDTVRERIIAHVGSNATLLQTVR